MKMLLAMLVLILLGLQYRLWVGTGSFAQIDQLSSQLEEQSEQNATLRERNDEVYAEISDLKEGLDSVEEHARSELGMIKEGETFYMIIEE